MRFYRTPGRHTPAAYASGDVLAYNVDGGLNVSAAAVHETLVHEIFHLNDQAAGDWSSSALAAGYDAVRARCGARTACLAPYAPGTTRVRGGTYYAFQPGNDVREYGAELMTRFVLEAEAALDGAPRQPAFKCGPLENASAWQALVARFFAGVDPTPACR